jgi:hypothetical protein
LKSQVYTVEVRGSREAVYASYSCPTQPYIAFTLEEGEDRLLDIILSYNVSPVHPRDPWLKPRERLGGLCTLHIAVDVDYRTGLEGERIAREGLVYFNPEKAWGGRDCTIIRPYIARWYIDWGRRQLESSNRE